jgi:hypothetical protein
MVYSKKNNHVGNNVDVKKLRKRLSVKLGMVGGVVMGALMAYPDATIMAWGQLPQEFKDAIPERWMPFLAASVFAIAALAAECRRRKTERPARKNVAKEKEAKDENLA